MARVILITTHAYIFFAPGATATSNAMFGEGSGPVFPSYFQCIGSERTLADCRTALTSSTTCSHRDDAGVQCQRPTSKKALYQTFYHNLYQGCTNGDLRLIGGSNALEGRVEVCLDGVWGTICSRLWSRADAAVVCRQLGYSSAGLKYIRSCYLKPYNSY